MIGRELRVLVIEMVMSTDMSCHFQQIKTMRNALTQTHRSELQVEVKVEVPLFVNSATFSVHTDD